MPPIGHTIDKADYPLLDSHSFWVGGRCSIVPNALDLDYEFDVAFLGICKLLLV